MDVPLPMPTRMDELISYRGIVFLGGEILFVCICISLTYHFTILKGRVHDLIKCPFFSSNFGPYVVNRSVLALKAGPV